MEKPKILCASIAGCAFFAGKQGVIYVAVAGAVEVGGTPAAAMICSAPISGIVLTSGYAG